MSRGGSKALRPGCIRFNGGFSELIRCGLLDQNVITRTAVQHVKPRTAIEHIVAFTPEQRVCTCTADEHVIIPPAIDNQLDHAVLKPRRLERVIAVQHINDELIKSGFTANNIHGRGEADNA